MAIPPKRDEAIELLRAIAESHPDDTFSRNQLAGVLSSSGKAEDTKEAIELLEAVIRNENTDNEFSRELLAKLKGKAKDVATLVEAPALAIGVEEGETVEDVLESEEGIEGADATKEVQPPEQLSRLALVGRLKFRLTYAQGEAKTAAIEELRETLKIDPTFAYAQLLAVRQGIWEDEGVALAGFPAAFELALSDQDVEALSRLAKEFPRLEALTIIARAMFGDENAAKRMESALRTTVNAKSGIERMLSERVAPMLRLIEGGKMSPSFLKKSREQVIAVLRHINEWAIGGGDWQLAA